MASTAGRLMLRLGPTAHRDVLGNGKMKRAGHTKNEAVFSALCVSKVWFLPGLVSGPPDVPVGFCSPGPTLEGWAGLWAALTHGQ